MQGRGGGAEASEGALAAERSAARVGAAREAAAAAAAHGDPAHHDAPSPSRAAQGVRLAPAGHRHHDEVDQHIRLGRFLSEIK